jgi:hypothetical protein
VEPLQAALAWLEVRVLAVEAAVAQLAQLVALAVRERSQAAAAVVAEESLALGHLEQVEQAAQVA